MQLCFVMSLPFLYSYIPHKHKHTHTYKHINIHICFMYGNVKEFFKVASTESGFMTRVPVFANCFSSEGGPTGLMTFQLNWNNAIDWRGERQLLVHREGRFRLEIDAEKANWWKMQKQQIDKRKAVIFLWTRSDDYLPDVLEERFDVCYLRWISLALFTSANPQEFISGASLFVLGPCPVVYRRLNVFHSLSNLHIHYLTRNEGAVRAKIRKVKFNQLFIHTWDVTCIVSNGAAEAGVPSIKDILISFKLNLGKCRTNICDDNEYWSDGVR